MGLRLELLSLKEKIDKYLTLEDILRDSNAELSIRLDEAQAEIVRLDHAHGVYIEMYERLKEETEKGKLNEK